uniref:HCLS1 binding protein 3 n=1 Tax=Lepisosteus oculatus TaxID=7918 RepID=W5NKV3_LEPOC
MFTLYAFLFRQLQNEDTGIDLCVPVYQEIRGSMMTGHVEYQIVVVSRLAAFKSIKHKPEDVVQLVVSKKYSEIDEFYQKLVAHYPKIALPAMPRKALFVGDMDIKERRVTFDELVKFISKNTTLATCPELLELAGMRCFHRGLSNVRRVKTTDVVDLKSKNVPEQEEEEEGFDFFSKEEVLPAEEIPRLRQNKTTKLCKPPDDDEEVEESLDPLGIIKSKKIKKPASEQRIKGKFSLFDEEVDPDDDLFEPAKVSSTTNKVLSAKDSGLKLFEDPDLGGAVKAGDSLLLPTAHTAVGAETDSILDEETEELFRVEDDFDKLLKVSRSAKPKPKLPPKPKPAVAKKPSSLSNSGASLPAAPIPESKMESMDQMDILKYIQQNESVATDNVDLF